VGRSAAGAAGAARPRSRTVRERARRIIEPSEPPYGGEVALFVGTRSYTFH
jgi:hypothetical protein